MASRRLLGALALCSLPLACNGQPSARAQPAAEARPASAGAAASLVASTHGTNVGDAPEGLLQRWAYVDNTVYYAYSNGGTPLTRRATGTLRLRGTGRYEKSFVVPASGAGAPTREAGTFTVTGPVIRFRPRDDAPYAQSYTLDEQRSSLTLTDVQADRDGNYHIQTLQLDGME